METYSEAALAAVGIHDRFVQDNQSFSAFAGTIRGLHFQRPPHAQAKLVRCVRGAILDVAVDLRVGAPTFGQAHAVELSADSGDQLFIPPGFAHGFVTLTPGAEVAYKVSAPHAPGHEGGLAWDDPDLRLDWPVQAHAAILTPRDRAWPKLKALDSPFKGSAPCVMSIVDLASVKA